MNKIKVILCASALLVAAGCKQTKSNKAIPPLRVDVAKVSVDSLYDQITFTSSVEGLHSATVQPRVSGFLTSINFTGGQSVKRGDLLLTIDPSTFTTSLYSARAARESAEAEELLAKRNYERAEPLAKIDAISQSDLDQYRATYKAAVASRRSAEESLRSAELEIGYTKIYAPIGGLCSESSATVGDYIGLETLQSALTTVTYLDTISVDLAIPTAKYLKYLSEQRANDASLLSNIVMTLPDSTTYNYTGIYDYTRTDTPQSTSTVVVVAKFPNPSLELKAGMFARIRANIGSLRGRIVLPRGAVSQLQGVNSVWVVGADSTVQWRRVELAGRTADGWIVESGVEPEESVVVVGGEKLHNGVKVIATATK